MPITALTNKKRVFVGMSGGVDSSLSAALLKEGGFDVVGVFIKVWQPDFAFCDWKKERLDAMRVAVRLGIPFKTYDFEKEYKKEVVDYMIEEYKDGRTPNPDVMCNKYIKFGSFLNKATKEGADFVATGHYAGKSQISNLKSKRYKLLKGVDQNKDQSYFLWTLKRKQLEKIIFPIGYLKKSQVREEARKRGLPVADKKDSQGLCFVGKIDMKDFLKEYIKERQGDVLNESGEVIGYHDGVFLYTMGERKGFVITKKTPRDKPYYVVEKDILQNVLVVSNEVKKENFESVTDTILMKNVNWIGSPPDEEKKIEARLRYRQNLRKCRVFDANDGWQAKFDDIQESVTPGQSIVFYDKEECLGGGIIR
ncbi:tRNA 2-thiouridine(34) synthase MnmA [Candidatus Campbellbacteria bacterium CG11_big_fil_rev_8_21_14_0_20_44_21]|nr:MAG: tRNA 2-thiouridine(34) synthase MnmA [Candidatus Campbellbacteria bacterium CG11_big_fil_rev_8_21_14_0_20_44_21]